ncbi:membrane protein [Mycolicibacterium doricum]|uniref:Hemolysin n=1 Tax=Mycolicibacterium doricum TaxID=126673 RepID=A0A1X1SZN2_9MYCO|nr:hemolysin family protein [Mycolicibacterium doricum]MCV7268307.1 HlyC/CorC family transporter [Mycolicibacterium doricum]ORV37379.1 hemolysin [Mycolicibacterium doricum]BBZ06532.1 membrane protein [Mycolicibacterium doricum]
MNDYWSNVALVAALVLVNGLLSGSEAAFISLREGQLRELEHRGGRRDHTVVRLAREPNRYLATIQLGITLAGFFASAAAAVTLAEPLAPLLSFLGAGARTPVSIAVVTVAVAGVTLVFGELAPKRLAMQNARRWALAVASPLSALSAVAAPIAWLLGKATDLVVQSLGGDPAVGREELTVEEFRELVTGFGGLTTEQRTIMSGALEIHERSLREVVVPRTAVFRLNGELPLPRARMELAASGHTRAPVARSGELDDATGVVHLRDLLGDRGTVGSVARPVLRLPDSLRVSAALRQLLAAHEHLALVVGERGGVDGIVTLEDLLEEIVGEIYDEADEDIRTATALPDGSHILPGAFPIHDLSDLGIEFSTLPPGDYTTIAGLVLSVLGRIPTIAGDCIDLPPYRVEVTGIGRHVITEVHIRPSDPH